MYLSLWQVSLLTRQKFPTEGQKPTPPPIILKMHFHVNETELQFCQLKLYFPPIVFQILVETYPEMCSGCVLSLVKVYVICGMLWKRALLISSAFSSTGRNGSSQRHSCVPITCQRYRKTYLQRYEQTFRSEMYIVYTQCFIFLPHPLILTLALALFEAVAHA